MDITLIAIGIFLIFAIAFLFFFLIKGISKKSFIADDGSLFKKQSDLDSYQDLYIKTKKLFSVDFQKAASQEILGFDNVFLKKLTKEGFQDLKTLVKYRQQIKSLSDLINN